MSVDGAIPFPSVQPALSGVRFFVTYHVEGDPITAQRRATDLCFEQTVELPEDLVPAGNIRHGVVGNIEDIDRGSSASRVVVSYAAETVGTEITQFLNVAFGNSSIKPGLRVLNIDLPHEMLRSFRGPRFGIAGLRDILGVPTRPLLCTALKPMGLSAADLAHRAYRFALGGIDMVKDDHGLADQPFAPFEERAARCADAVRMANRETGGTSLYVPNVTAAFPTLLERARRARALGAGGLLLAPALTGIDAVRVLAEDDSLGLPLLVHPAFAGAWTTSPTCGIDHGVYYGLLMRLAGADGTIFPSFGGRFAFSRDECQRIAASARRPMGHVRSIFPVPGGGIGTATVADALATYRRDVILLVGGGLLRLSSNLTEACTRLRATVDSAAEATAEAEADTHP